MNKALMGLVAVVVVGIGIYFLTANKKANDAETVNTNETTDQTNQTQTADQKRSLKDLMASGSQKCTYTDGQNSTTVYVADGRTRMDMTSVVNGVNTSTHAVIDNDTYYTWVDGQPSGFKFSIKNQTTGTAGPNQNVDLNQQFNYNCDNWSSDSSMFNVPSGIQFTDYSSFQMPTGN